jgi:hypothetical protein
VTLDHIAAGVLYRLWKRRRNNDGSLVSAQVLRQELVGGLALAVFREDLSVNAVKRTLRALKTEGMVEYGTSVKNDSNPGPPPKGFRLSVDAPIITWRASAALVIWLHNHQERRLKRETVIDEQFSRGLTHHNLDRQLTKDEIGDLIDWCIRKGYIEEGEGIAYESTTATAERRLITTSKVDEFALYLSKIASEVKLQVVAEQPLLSYGESDVLDRG